MQQAALKTTEPLIGNGTYILEIPDGYFCDGNGREIKGITLRYTVKNDSGETAGIEDIIAESKNGLTVYTTTGVKVAETTDSSIIDALPSGIYIINGKKVFIK